jgi:TPR repeat protein
LTGRAILRTYPGFPRQSIDLSSFRPASPTAEEYYDRGVTSHRAGNLAVAYEHYQRAYQKDFFKAYTRVGLFALEGLGGVPINRQKAQADFEHAASCGHVDAMFNLGRMAEKGHTMAGTPDIHQAIAWYQKTLKADPTYPRCQEKIDTLTAQNEAKTPQMRRK